MRRRAGKTTLRKAKTASSSCMSAMAFTLKTFKTRWPQGECGMCGAPGASWFWIPVHILYFFHSQGRKSAAKKNSKTEAISCRDLHFMGPWVLCSVFFGSETHRHCAPSQNGRCAAELSATQLPTCYYWCTFFHAWKHGRRCWNSCPLQVAPACPDANLDRAGVTSQRACIKVPSCLWSVSRSRLL